MWVWRKFASSEIYGQNVPGRRDSAFLRYILPNKNRAGCFSRHNGVSWISIVPDQISGKPFLQLFFLYSIWYRPLNIASSQLLRRCSHETCALGESIASIYRVMSKYTWNSTVFRSRVPVLLCSKIVSLRPIYEYILSSPTSLLNTFHPLLLFFFYTVKHGPWQRPTEVEDAETKSFTPLRNLQHKKLKTP